MTPFNFIFSRKTQLIRLISASICMFATCNAGLVWATSPPSRALTAAEIDHQNYTVTTTLREPRLQSASDLKSVAATIAGAELRPLKLVPNYTASGTPPGHYLFLIDTSITMRGKPLTQALNLVEQLVSILPDNTVHSVASFDKELKFWVEAQSKPDFDPNTLTEMSAKGKVTELYRLVLESMKDLVNNNAARPTVVILSDGRVEDTNYSDQDVIDYALSQQIILHGLAFKYTVEAQSLRRLSEATGGVFTEVNDTGKIDDDALIYLRQASSNGGLASFDLSSYEGSWGTSTSIQFTYTFDNSFSTQAQHTITLPDRSWLAIPFQGYPRLWWVAGAATAGILLVLLLVVLRKGKQSDSVEEDTERCPACNKAIQIDWQQCHACGSPLNRKDALAQLTTVDNTLTQTFGIYKALTSIGRLDDNDIVLNDDTISRRQANIIYKDHLFFIQDLGSANTTRCNGKEISASTQLKHGDEVQFGELKLRFEENDMDLLSQ